MTMDKNIRDARINRMSEAFTRLRIVADILCEKADELEANASDVDLLKDYISSGQWLEDFEADEAGELGPGVDHSVLSEDGLYDLLADMDNLMHTFERLLDRFSADPELDKMLEGE